ncbi:hypothetical protein CHGG_04007 [Chaetomium globosum CBS 148.51]|uniref:Uncharacterized protein n=1 Tax=Chaetomium globosum (strain ATCC 6205 / CBS 148.51 / DSM 1962 / NBRC 6347 / NRRL 1970) TaxID=306901 RepID=Q2H2I9_CHAGB|nr:uncharacterized protein CHGG_04007 [Chaetomium globosum CBS 148.51]EAQ87388.1 hypothetical protein CHGG_04007 [Chaetomium globosum CBS 148.51]
MVDLTISETSGLIAAAVFLVQVLLSLIFPAALVGFVDERNTAVTWSVLGRSLQSSPWPTLLQTDAAARHGVLRRVSNGLLFQTVVVLLISVAAIVTPLGLYQTVEPGDPSLETFQFVKDKSSFGYATPDQVTGPFTRSCGLDTCPGSWVNRTCVQQGLLQNCSEVVYGRAIPDLWRSTLREGAEQVDQSVSSIFDIQWRSRYNASDALGESGWYLKSGYRQVDILILDSTIQLVDGLIVDTKNGGIGFRNHTAPAAFHEYGTTWSEDILFIEPEAQCVDLNVTFDFELSQNQTGRLTPRKLALVDHGGFSALSRTSPDLTIPKDGNGQDQLDLRERAYKAAWANNFLTLATFNATDPDADNITRLDVTPGMKFFADEDDSSVANHTSLGFRIDNNVFAVDYQSIRSTLDFGDYLRFESADSTNGSEPTRNPWMIGEPQFNLVSEICAGGDHDNPANINSSLVGCGLVYGSARRTDGGSDLSPDPGSQWSLPAFSCAASVRATIRTVTFQHNGTGLAALHVLSAAPKTYPSPADHPHWAVENMGPTNLWNAQPLWGILPPSQSAPPPTLNLTTVRQPTLRLPGIVTAESALSGGDYVSAKQGQNLPGVDFYVRALQNVFGIRRPGAVGYEGYADYSGQSSLALYRKWQGLSGSAEGVAEVVRLVWTDIAANAVVGTKGWGLDDPVAAGRVAGGGVVTQKRDGAGGKVNDKVLVTVYRRRVRYRLPYMVPAAVVLALAIVVLGTWLVLLVMGRTGPAKMRRLLDATSPGRILGGFLWPNKAATLRGTDEWVKTVGTRVVIVGSGPGDAVAAAAKQGEADRDQEGQVVGEESIQLIEKNKPVVATGW